MPGTLVFVANYRQHKKIADRLLGALDADLTVQLYAFDRGTVPHRVYQDPRVRHISLGAQRDGLGSARLPALLRAAWRLRRGRPGADEPDVIVLANTLETLLLVRLAGLHRHPVIYDVGDIHPLQLRRTIGGRIARAIESRLLRFVKALVVSSPWFYWRYFRGYLRSDRPGILIENRVRFDERPAPADRRFRPAIAWNGLLRCRRSARVLLESLRQEAGFLTVALHGSFDRIGSLGDELLAQAGCRFTGAYQVADLPGRLRDSSFVWAIDYAELDNSTWLLPNRLYEAIACGLPLIAAAGTATAAVVEHYALGLVLPRCSADALLGALHELDESRYCTWLANIDALRARAMRGEEWAALLGSRPVGHGIMPLPDAEDVGVVLADRTARPAAL